MRKLTAAAAIAAAALTASSIPATAQEGLPSTGEVITDVSGTRGFDRNANDYDILRQSLAVTGLDEVVAGAQDTTIFAPTDRAFKRLARSLGWEGTRERSAFRFIARTTQFESVDDPGLLDDFLLYHVSPGAQTRRELRGQRDVATGLDGPTLSFGAKNRIIDADPDARNAKFIKPGNILVSEGIVHTVSQVLRPLDLPEAGD